MLSSKLKRLLRQRWVSPAVAALTLLVASAATEPSGPVEKHRKPEDIERIRGNLRRGRCRVVVVGNSLVGQGVHHSLLEEELGVPVYRLWRNSMRSAWWYLALKNVIVPAGATDLVVICFRNTVLTDPQRAVEGEYKEGVGQLATEHEPLLHRLAYYAHLDEFHFLLLRYWSLFQRRAHVKHKIETKVKKHVARRLFDDDWDEDEMEDAIENVLADEKMAEHLITEAQDVAEARRDPAAYDFEQRVEESFLPHIIRIARENGIRLAFVRMKTRRDAARQEDRDIHLRPHPRPELLEEYIADLRDYLAGHGVPMLDFTDHPKIKLHHFREHDHFTDEGQKLFTRLLAERLGPHLETAVSMSGGAKDTNGGEDM